MLLLIKIVNEERNKWDISVIENIFMKRELKRRNSGIYISDDSWIVMDTQWHICKHEPIGVV